MRSFARLVTAILLILAGTSLAGAKLPAEMELMAENDHLALYIDPVTTEIALWDKGADALWFSNPPGRNRRQETGQEVVQIRYDAPTSPDKLMSSYTHSVQLGQAEILPIDSGVRVEYLLGAEYDARALGVPQMVKAARFEKDILGQVSASEKSTLLRYYTPIQLREPYPFELRVTSAARSLEEKLFAGLIIVPCTEDYQKLIEQAEKTTEPAELRRLEEEIAQQRMDVLYGLLEKFTGYLLGSGEGERSVGYRKDVTTASDLKAEDFAHLAKEPSYLLGRLAPLLQDQVQRIFQKLGRGVSDLALDHVANRLDPPVPLLERFFIPVEYRLDGKDLLVTIPMEEVVYPLDQPTAYKVRWDAAPGEELVEYDYSRELASCPLTSIALLRFFGAADSTEEGYIFVPDGCGALINLNNGKTDQTLYSEPVYGWDGALPITEQLPYAKQINHFPVFGMKRSDQAFLAVIEAGDAIAQIRADIARPASPYNVAYAAFQTIPKSSRRLDQFTQISLYQTRAYQGDLTVRYSFLYGPEATYSGMARCYQQYLVNQGRLKPQAKGQGIPFFLEVIGVVPKIQPVLGVAREVQLPLTTFAQAQAMTAELLAAGVTNLSLRYTGWLKGGIHHRYPGKVQIAPGLGGREGLKALGEFLAENNVGFYPAVEFLKVQRSGLLQGFYPRRDAARAINGLYATLPDYDPVTNQALAEPVRYVLSTRVLPDLMESFLKDFRSLDIGGLALPSFGREIHSDLQRSKTRLVDRVQAAAKLEEELAKLAETGLDLQIDGGNALSLGHARTILNVPQKSTGYHLTDAEVPFMQMVLHGYVPYSGEPVNQGVDLEESILRSAQSASGLYLKLIWEEPSILKETEYDRLLSVDKERWLQKSSEIYMEYQGKLGDLAAEPILEFTQLTPTLTVTSFQSGDEVVVNLGESDEKYRGIMIPARTFVRVRGVN